MCIHEKNVAFPIETAAKESYSYVLCTKVRRRLNGRRPGNFQEKTVAKLASLARAGGLILFWNSERLQYSKAASVVRASWLLALPFFFLRPAAAAAAFGCVRHPRERRDPNRKMAMGCLVGSRQWQARVAPFLL